MGKSTSHSLRLKFAEWWGRHLDMAALVALLSIVVGGLTAVAGWLMHLLVGRIAQFSGWLGGTAGWMSAFPLPLLGIFLSYLAQRAFTGSGKFVKSLSPLILKLDRRQGYAPVQDCCSHIVTSSLCIGFGGSAGQEAPGVLTGAAIGANISRLVGFGRISRSLLIGCGCAAALSAIFDSPIAGVLFVVEALLPEFSVSALVPLLLSSAVASVIAKSLSGKPIFFASNALAWHANEVFPTFLCGIVCALVGVYVIRCTFWVSGQMERRFRSTAWRMLFGGVLLCVLLLAFPFLRGQGYAFIESLMQGGPVSLENLMPWCPVAAVSLVMLGAAILLKAVVSSLTISSGGDGGIFAPTMFIGAFTGFGFAWLLKSLGWQGISDANFAALGMCGVFTAVMRAPLTGVFLIAETTGGYTLLVPLMIVSAVSWFTGRFFEPDSIYRKSLVKAKLLSDDPQERELRAIRVKAVCQSVKIHFSKGQLMSEVLAELRAKKASAELYPVLEPDGTLAGVLHADKLLVAVLDSGKNHPIRVEDLMEMPSGAVSPEETLWRAMCNLQSHRLHVLPVLAKGGRFVGILTKERILEQLRVHQTEGE